jgi:hypothetical protein
MSAKPKAVSAAEKRQIKSEIATRKKALRKVATDCRRERKAYAALRRQWEIKIKRLDNSEAREIAKNNRRIAILEARLHS